MPVKLAAGVAATVLFLSVMPVFAHHAFSAEFDVNKPIRLEGTVAKMEWVNPHAWIHIDVKKPDGSTERWMIEGGTPNTLFRRGVTKQLSHLTGVLAGWTPEPSGEDQARRARARVQREMDWAAERDVEPVFELLANRLGNEAHMTFIPDLEN